MIATLEQLYAEHRYGTQRASRIGRRRSCSQHVRSRARMTFMAWPLRWLLWLGGRSADADDQLASNEGLGVSEVRDATGVVQRPTQGAPTP